MHRSQKTHPTSVPHTCTHRTIQPYTRARTNSNLVPTLLAPPHETGHETGQDADTIFVLHEGDIVEAGSHDELLDLGGHYRKMWNLQAQNDTKCKLCGRVGGPVHDCDKLDGGDILPPGGIVS